MKSLSPLRKLVQAHAENLITREEYLNIRTLLLDKLEQKGHLNHKDLDNFYNLKDMSNDIESAASYSSTDIIITLLGLLAAGVLAYILYS